MPDENMTLQLRGGTRMDMPGNQHNSDDINGYGSAAMFFTSSLPRGLGVSLSGFLSGVTRLHLPPRMHGSLSDKVDPSFV